MNITQTVIAERDRALLGGDYGSYHAQTARRIRTLRRKLEVTTPRGKKFTAKAPITSEHVGRNIQWVHLLLASAERLWADAMSMKSKQSPENTQKPMPGSTKKQIVSRLRKAITYATALVVALSDQSTTKASSIDLLEAKAYLGLLQGGLEFERNRWTSCIQKYSYSRIVYATLGASTKSDVYRDLLSNTVDPSIRYAAYQEKLPRTKAVPDISIDHFPSSEGESRTAILTIDSHAFETTAEKAAAQSEGVHDLPLNIEWRGRNVQIEDASISQALSLAAAREDTLLESYKSFKNGDKDIRELAASYDDAITARQDAVDATKAAIEELVSEGIEQGDARIQRLQVTRTAVNFAVIELRIGRNRVLCGLDDGIKDQVERQSQTTNNRKDGKPKVIKTESSGRHLARLREHAALYDSILQSLEAVKQLPGVMSDVEFLQDLDGKYAYFRALKCLAIGRSHAVNNQTRNALGLFAQANDLAHRSTSGIKLSVTASETPPKLEISSEEIQNLQSHLASIVIQYRALTDLESFTESQSKQSKIQAPPLLETLHKNRYDEDVDLKNIVDYPPKLRPIPLQPLFFDLAWNYIQYPGRTEEQPSVPISQSVSETKKDEGTKKKGWFSFRGS